MKHIKTLLILTITLSVFSCSHDSIFSGSKISYAEASDLVNISFKVDGEDIESSVIGEVPFQQFFCHDWPEECKEDYGLYYKSYALMIDPNADNGFRFIMTPGVQVPEVLFTSPNLMYYDVRPEFTYQKNIEQLYLKEGLWFSDNRRVQFHLLMGEPEDRFYSDYVLEETDQFEITEIKEISDKANAFLVSGIFNVIIPDGRKWLPEDELQDPKTLSGGIFSIIVEPIEEK